MTDFLDPSSAIAQPAEEFFPDADAFFTELLNKLKGTGKRIVLIDMGVDDPGYHYFIESLDLIDKYQEKVREYKQGNNISLDELQKMAHDLRIALAQADEYREQAIEGQLRALAMGKPNSKISVMLGAVHTPVYHDMAKDHKVSRRFIPTDRAKATYPEGVKMLFGSATPLRTIRFHLGELGLSVTDKNKDSKEKQS